MSDLMNQKNSSINKQDRAQMIKDFCSKISEMDMDAQAGYFNHLISQIDDLEIVPVSKSSRKTKGENKVIRKKTIDEIKVLKFFFAQDPSWSKRTVATVAKILDMVPYQAYKWGYDRKSKKHYRFDAQSEREVGSSIQLSQKICQFEKEFKMQKSNDFNQCVDELLFKGSNLSNQNLWTEKLSDNDCISQSSKETAYENDESPYHARDFKSLGNCKVFSIKKVRKQQIKKPVPKWAFSECIDDLDIFEKKEKTKLPKLSELDLIEKQSWTTKSHSSISYGVASDKSYQHLEATPYSE